MKAIPMAALWVVGWLLAVFGLTIGLAWYTFGYLDLVTVGEMSLLLLPPLGAAILVVVFAGRQESRAARRELDSHYPKEVDCGQTTLAGSAARGGAKEA